MTFFHRETEPNKRHLFGHMELTIMKSHPEHWSLLCLYAQFIGLSILRCRRRKGCMNSREMVSKTFSSLLSCMIKIFMNSPNLKVRNRLDALRLLRDKLLLLDSSMNIRHLQRFLGVHSILFIAKCILRSFS